MTLFEATRKALLAGVGVQTKVRELIDELIEKGELSETQGAKLIKEWSEKADKTGKDFGKSITELIDKALDTMNLPARDDVEKLNRKVMALSARIKKLEEAVGAKEAE